MGQVNLVRYGLPRIGDGGSVTLTRGVRINLVSPPWVTESLEKLGMDPAPGLPAARWPRPTFIEPSV